MKIIAVVPTYNRPGLLKKNLDCLLGQTRPLDEIILVDNASEADTARMLQENGYFDIEKIKYLRLDVNTGASGGFGTGMRSAMEAGADWIWGMDDDAFPHSDALNKLLEINAEIKQDCLWSNVDEDNKFDGRTKKVDHLMFVGYFVSRNLVEKVGYPDLKFYMYHDDTDYSNRIIKKGFDIVKIRDSIIDHKGFDKRGRNPTQRYNVLGFSFEVLNCESYRVYYIFRNAIFAQHKFGSKVRCILRTALIDLPKYAVSRPRSARALALGLIHALIGKSGKVALPSEFDKNYYA